VRRARNLDVINRIYGMLQIANRGHARCTAEKHLRSTSNHKAKAIAAKRLLSIKALSQFSTLEKEIHDKS
jgi:hypothetical protein